VEQLVPLPHYLLQVFIVSAPDVRETGLTEDIAAGEDVAAVSAHRTRYKLIVLNSLSAPIGGDELIDGPRVLDSKGPEPPGDDSNGEILAGVDAFPQKEGKLIWVVIDDQFHVVEHIPVGLEDADGGVIVGMGHDDEMLAVDDQFVFLVLEDFVVAGLFVEEIFQTGQHVR
jgi:hypothetical protein